MSDLRLAICWVRNSVACSVAVYRLSAHVDEGFEQDIDRHQRSFGSAGFERNVHQARLGDRLDVQPPEEGVDQPSPGRIFSPEPDLLPAELRPLGKLQALGRPIGQDRSE